MDPCCFTLTVTEIGLFFNSLECFVKTYKMKRSPPAETAESIESTVRGIMDELLQGIVKTFPENPTIPHADSRAETPSR